MEERPQARRESIGVAIVAAAALATGVAVAILARVPFSALDSGENLTVVTVAGLVIFAGGMVVASVICRHKRRS